MHVAPYRDRQTRQHRVGANLSIYVIFKGTTIEHRYSFTGDLAQWHDHFIKMWRKAGHKVRIAK